MPIETDAIKNVLWVMEHTYSQFVPSLILNGNTIFPDDPFI